MDAREGWVSRFVRSNAWQKAGWFTAPPSAAAAVLSAVGAGAILS